MKLMVITKPKDTLAALPPVVKRMFPMWNSNRNTAVVVWVAVIGIAFLAGTLVPAARTQSGAEPQYAAVSYMKVDPAKENAYVQMERELWMPIHRQRIRDGRLKSWSLYEVRLPGGTGREYGFMTVETFGSIQDAAGAYEDTAQVTALMKKVHPGKEAGEFLARTTDSRSLVRSEVLRLVDQVK